MQKHPNILLITGDHVRHDAVGCNLDPQQDHCLARAAQTPNLDAIAGDGVTFSNSFTSDPICVPGRASLTTGRYPHKCIGCKGNKGLIKDEEVKLAAYFAGHGYSTCAIGKLHYVPYAPPGQPRLLHGFEHAELCEEGRIISHFGPNGDVSGLEDYHDYLKSVGWDGYERAHGIGNNDVHPSPSPVPEEHHEEAWVAARSIEWLKAHQQQNPGKPFLLWSSFIKPHPPYDPPQEWIAKFDPRRMPTPLGAGNEELMAGRDIELRTNREGYGWDRLAPTAIQLIRAYYCAMMSFQDAMIGRIVDHLSKAELYDDTIVVYTADHGDLLGDFGRFFKTNMMDGSVKVPLIIRVPGMNNGGESRRPQLAGLQDVLPTLASLAGLPVPAGLDGIDLKPAINDPEAPSRKFYISQTADSPHQKYMLRTERWKYIYTEIGGVEELYDVTQHNYELYNLAGNSEHEQTLREMREELCKWCRENEDFEMLDEAGNLRTSDPSNQLSIKGIQIGRLGWRKF
ncbi:MAG: sulfatase [Kiritimatiellia bacterium]|nr:sulfatase-like hydrolase/transferase [Lentisphaerota bacterium]